MKVNHIKKPHNKTLLIYHLVCPVKYRRDVFTQEVSHTLKTVCLEFGPAYDINFLEIGMDEWGLLPPIFKNTSNSFRVILPGEQLSQLNSRQVKIWEYLTDNQKITRREAEGVLGDVPAQTINHDLRRMKEIGLIQQEGQSSNIYYRASF